MITEKVREYLKTADLHKADLQHIADQFGMASSTMAWRLRRDGVTFLKLRDDERKARAAALLVRNPHADTAAMIRVTGYAEASISRAVRRWFGCTLPQARQYDIFGGAA